jgi:8-oxo-dGTP pyrophosphatase MutT (NUDIX family)
LPIAFALADRLARLREQPTGTLRSAPSDPGGTWAAVAVIVVPNPDAILLIRRSERAGDPWSGHLALPGGRQDPADGDLFETAVRETREEVGIQLESADLVASLEPVVPRTPVLPPISILPFVFLLSTRPQVIPNAEVASTAWIELDHLLLPTTRGQVSLDVAGASRSVDAYQLEHGLVWGLTERILTSFLRTMSG